MRIKKLLLFIFVGFFTIGMLQPQYTFDACDSVSECDTELDKLAEDIKNTEAEIAANKQNASDLRDQVEAINEKVMLTTQQIETLEGSIATLNTDIDTKEKEIEGKDKIVKEQLLVQQKQQNSNTFLSLLFSSDSLSDFMTRWSAVETLSSKEKELLDELAKIKAELEATKEKQTVQKQSLEDTKASLASTKAEKETLMQAAHAEIEQQEASLEDLSATASDIEKQREILNQPPPPSPSESGNGGSGGGGGSTPSSGSWYLPVDPGAYVTTYYLQMYEYSSTPHLGADIASYSNAPIYPMADGYVLASGWYGMFGNLVAVGHVVDGVSYVSLYGHMNYRNVSEGQYVYGGSSVLGGMGNTGYSFGTHLHLELAYRDYFTVNKSTRTNTNTDPLAKLNWRGAYYDIA